MTKEKKADLLLEAARDWQNSRLTMANFTRVEGILDFVLDVRPFDGDHYLDNMTIWASAALSEVAALGFDIEDA